MLLSLDEAKLFFKLHGALMEFVNAQLKVVDVPESDPAYSSLPPGQRHKVVKAFLGRLDLIDSFIATNPRRFSEEELDIVSSWRHLVTGRFIALRQLKKHMIFLASAESPTAYAVTALVDPLDQVIPTPFPAMIETVLLPFRDKIIYDGLVNGFNVTFGPGSRRRFEEDFRTAKANNSVVTSLPRNAPGAPAPRPVAPQPKKIRAPQPPVADVREVLQQLATMTDAFCQSHLNEEYAALCRKLAEKLAAKRPSPLLRGNLETWACGIVRTIGWVNFLDDRSQMPHMKLPVIDEAFGVAESTGQGKSMAIRRLLKIRQFDHRWTRPSKWEGNPLIWQLQDSNGFIIDIRQQPVALQRAAFKKGLIPYVPADRAAAAVQAQIAGSASRRLFQFKITLRDSAPLIWRRIQVLDDTLDKLHEHIQTSMGWTNSHLHQFVIQDQRYGDPELLNDGFESSPAVDSTKTLISAVLPADGAPLSFSYRYDFGDCWEHDVLLEGCPPPQPGVTYPQCLEGARACPPDNVGGIRGYAEYLEAIADSSHKRHAELFCWNGPFNPDTFNPRHTTHVMQEGMPDWRKKV